MECLVLFGVGLLVASLVVRHLHQRSLSTVQGVAPTSPAPTHTLPRVVNWPAPEIVSAHSLPALFFNADLNPRGEWLHSGKVMLRVTVIDSDYYIERVDTQMFTRASPGQQIEVEVFRARSPIQHVVMSLLRVEVDPRCNIPLASDILNQPNVKVPGLQVIKEVKKLTEQLLRAEPIHK